MGVRYKRNHFAHIQGETKRDSLWQISNWKLIEKSMHKTKFQLQKMFHTIFLFIRQSVLVTFHENQLEIYLKCVDWRIAREKCICIYIFGQCSFLLYARYARAYTLPHNVNTHTYTCTEETTKIPKRIFHVFVLNNGNTKYHRCTRSEPTQKTYHAIHAK